MLYEVYQFVVTCGHQEGIGKDPIIFISLLTASSELLRQIFNLTLEGNSTASFLFSLPFCRPQTTVSKISNAPCDFFFFRDQLRRHRSTSYSHEYIYEKAFMSRMNVQYQLLSQLDTCEEEQ